MKTKLDRKRLFGHRGQILAWLIVTFVALSLPLASRAFAQDKDRVISGAITNLWMGGSGGGGELTIRVGARIPMRFEITEKTQWIGLSGQKLHGYDVGHLEEVHVSVKYHDQTSGRAEAVEVRITEKGFDSNRY